MKKRTIIIVALLALSIFVGSCTTHRSCSGMSPHQQDVKRGLAHWNISVRYWLLWLLSVFRGSFFNSNTNSCNSQDWLRELYFRFRKCIWEKIKSQRIEVFLRRRNCSLPTEYLFVLANIHPSIKNKKHIFKGGCIYFLISKNILWNLTLYFQPSNQL